MNLIYNPKETELMDIDDVIRDWNPFLNQVWNRENPSRKKNLPGSWDLANNYGSDITEFYQQKHAEEIYLKAPLVPGAREFLNELAKIRLIYLVSSQPNEQIEEYTKHWVIINQIPFSYYKFTHNKGSVFGNHLLDDGVHNLESALESGRSAPVLFKRDWNQNEIGKRWKGLFVETHQEFLDLVRNHH
ncbi:MAG: hypothetical protein QT11_C0001G0845 [archaeon GW2011_AR20]|nr:MAG: hypothetical protein QT11_C0001G0845 [archaeon GW2011_AR20]MBS3160210.1 hypothetical protein [Candidatus Woesearchaeota archaeon]